MSQWRDMLPIRNSMYVTPDESRPYDLFPRHVTRRFRYTNPLHWLGIGIRICLYDLHLVLCLCLILLRRLMRVSLEPSRRDQCI